MSVSSVIVGFIPLLDCAPLVAAAEKGFAAEEGLDLKLIRETSWANIRDRVVVGHFDAAHMLGPMAVASTLGIGHLKVPIVAPFALGLGGNAITVSNALWDRMRAAGASSGADPAIQGNALRGVIAKRTRGNLPPLTFAMVYPFSCHNYELRYWLAASGIDPDHDVRLLVLPPPLLVDALQEGHLDGFCVGEPWNSLAVSVGAGHIVTATTAIWRFSPEKVLGCRLDWTIRSAQRTSSLVRALYRAAQWCEHSANHAELASLLARPEYVGAPPDVLMRGLTNRLALSPGDEPQLVPDFYVPASHDATFPWRSHATWFYSQMVRWGQIDFSPEHLPQVDATYRPDLYRLALEPLAQSIPTEDRRIEGVAGDGFFDGRIFDPADLGGYLKEA